MTRLSYRGSRMPRFSDVERPEAIWIRFVRDAQRHWRDCGLPVCRRARQCAGGASGLGHDVQCARKGQDVPPMPFDFGTPWLCVRLGVRAANGRHYAVSVAAGAGTCGSMRDAIASLFQ